MDGIEVLIYFLCTTAFRYKITSVQQQK